MKQQPAEDDPVLRLIDAVLGDLAVRGGMYVGRRPEDGDAATFLIQFGEGASGSGSLTRRRIPR
jgi:hypothetical protein